MKTYVKVKFDPMSAEHVREYQNFRRTRSWGNGCRFILEWPYMSIPDMIVQKLMDCHLKTIHKGLL